MSLKTLQHVVCTWVSSFYMEVVEEDVLQTFRILNVKVKVHLKRSNIKMFWDILKV